jgi:hypothetical protein
MDDSGDCILTNIEKLTKLLARFLQFRWSEMIPMDSNRVPEIEGGMGDGGTGGAITTLHEGTMTSANENNAMKFY